MHLSKRWSATTVGASVADAVAVVRAPAVFGTTVVRGADTEPNDVDLDPCRLDLVGERHGLCVQLALAPLRGAADAARAGVAVAC